METEVPEVPSVVESTTNAEEPIPQPLENPPEPTTSTTSATTSTIPDDQQLIQSIRKIIDAGDLETLTFNQVFNTLSKEFQADLSEKKTFLKQKLLEIISQKNEENEQQEEVEEKPKKSKAKKKKEPAKKSPSKKAKKEKEAQASDESSEEEEERIEAEYELQKQLLEAVKTGVMPSTRRTRSGNSTPTKRASNGKRKTNGKKTVEDSESEDGEGEPVSPKKKKRGFVAKNMALSEPLSAFLGGKNMIPRTEVVKDLHAYIKEHNLQNPANKKQILFDEKLQSVFKVKSTDYFKINKLISKHVKPADEVV